VVARVIQELLLGEDRADKFGWALLCRTENSDFEQLAARSVWLPKRIERHWFQWEGRGPIAKEAVVVEQFLVQSMSAELITPEIFVLNYDVPGTFVSNAKLADAMNSDQDKLDYQIPAKQEDLDRVIEEAALGEGYRKPRPMLPRSLLILGCVILATGVTWLVVRQRRT